MTEYLLEQCPRCYQKALSEFYAGYVDITEFNPHIEAYYYTCHNCKWQLKKLVDLNNKIKDRYIRMFFTDDDIQYEEINNLQ